MGILASPRETINSLAESKRLLMQTRDEILEKKERESIPPKHTFAPPPGLQHREQQAKILKTRLSSIPNFTVLFGSTSVGKTALLRQVLTDQRYHVIHFDLRIAGFADIESLFFSFSHQMEQYFIDLANNLEGYQSFEREALALKHLRLDVQRRLEKNGPPIKTSDIAHLLEIFQSCLLKYWEFTPVNPEELESKKEKITNQPVQDWKRKKSKASRTVELEKMHKTSDHKDGHNTSDQSKNLCGESKINWEPPAKLIPVFFLDEAHKLPVLIKDPDAMKCILDGLLVLTKQDRLCHVIHATSDPFYLYWLRRMDVLTHCTIMTIADPSKKEAQEYFEKYLLGAVRRKNQQAANFDNSITSSQSNEVKGSIQQKSNQVEYSHSSDDYELDFELVYETFGARPTHLQGFVDDYLNSDGKLRPKQSSLFIQAYALLHHHLINNRQEKKFNHSGPLNSDGAKGGKLISNDPFSHHSCYYDNLDGFERRRDSEIIAQDHIARFNTKELLYVISKFTCFDVDRSTGQIILDHSISSSTFGSENVARARVDLNSVTLDSGNKIKAKQSTALETFPYFKLCREMGTRRINDMIQVKILDLRWTQPIGFNPYQQDQHDTYMQLYSQDDISIEPVVLPISPVMKAAMQSVLHEHLSENLVF